MTAGAPRRAPTDMALERPAPIGPATEAFMTTTGESGFGTQWSSPRAPHCIKKCTNRSTGPRSNVQAAIFRTLPNHVLIVFELCFDFACATGRRTGSYGPQPTGRGGPARFATLLISSKTSKILQGSWPFRRAAPDRTHGASERAPPKNEAKVRRP